MPQSPLARRASWSRRLSLVPAIALLCLTGAPSKPPRMVKGLTARLRAGLKNPSVTAAADTKGYSRLLILNGTFIPHKGRLDVAGTSGNAEIDPSQYILLGDSTLTVVNTTDGTYQPQKPYDIGSLIAMVTAIDNCNPVTNPSVKWTKLADDSLNGIPTRHYSFDIEYGLPRGDVNAITRAKGEYWLADLPVNFYNPFAGLARPKGGITGEQAPAIISLYKALKELQVGTVLKFKASGIIGEGSPNPTAYIRTVDVLNVKEVEVDEKMFELPPTYYPAGAAAGRGGAAGGGGGGGGGGRGGGGGGGGGAGRGGPRKRDQLRQRDARHPARFYARRRQHGRSRSRDRYDRWPRTRPRHRYAIDVRVASRAIACRRLASVWIYARCSFPWRLREGPGISERIATQ